MLSWLKPTNTLQSLPVKAIHIANDCAISENSGKKFYRVLVRVKFNNGHSKNIQFNTDETYQTLISAEQSTQTIAIVRKSAELYLWEQELFNCCKIAKSDKRDHYLFSFEASQWVSKGIATKENINDFYQSPPESKSVCRIS